MLEIFQLVDFVVLKIAFINIFGTQPATEILRMYPLAELVLLKNGFVKFSLISHLLEHSEFTN